MGYASARMFPRPVMQSFRVTCEFSCLRCGLVNNFAKILWAKDKASAYCRFSDVTICSGCHAALASDSDMKCEIADVTEL
jgi:hypothetical protein